LVFYKGAWRRGGKSPNPHTEVLIGKYLFADLRETERFTW